MEVLASIILIISITFFHELGHYLFFISEVGIVPTIYVTKFLSIGVGNNDETLQTTAKQMTKIYIAGIVGGLIPFAIAILLGYISNYESILFLFLYTLFCLWDILGLYQLFMFPRKYHHLKLKYFKTFIVDENNKPKEMIDDVGSERV